MFLYWIAAAAFSIWMLVDAVRRRAEPWWFVVILMFMPLGLLLPLGALVYFMAVKSRDYDFGRFRALAGDRRSSIGELSYRAQETPSVANKLAYAEALQVAARYGEASDEYRDVLRRDPTNRHALHGVGCCLLGLGKPEAACEALQKLLEADNAWADFGAALDYADALWQAGRQDDAIELLRGLVAVSNRINHRVALAHYLIQAERAGPARDVLDQALRDYEHSPTFVKRRDRKWAERAEKMLRDLG